MSIKWMNVKSEYILLEVKSLGLKKRLYLKKYVIGLTKYFMNTKNLTETRTLVGQRRAMALLQILFCPLSHSNR